MEVPLAVPQKGVEGVKTALKGCFLVVRVGVDRAARQGVSKDRYSSYVHHPVGNEQYEFQFEECPMYGLDRVGFSLF